MGKFLTFVGDSVARLLTHVDLAGLGAEARTLEQLGENKAIAFVRGVAQHVESDLATFIAEHPAIGHEFHVLSDEEAAAELAQRTGNSDGSSGSTASSPTNTENDGAPTTSSSSSASGENSTPSA